MRLALIPERLAVWAVHYTMMPRVILGAFSATMLFVVPSVLGAQQGGTTGGRGAISVPPAYMPPPGMCRVWVPGVAANRQAAITTCAVAVRNRAGDAQVIYGRDTTAVKPPAKGSRPDTAKVLPIKVLPTKIIPPLPRTDTSRTRGRP